MIYDEHNDPFWDRKKKIMSSMGKQCQRGNEESCIDVQLFKVEHKLSIAAWRKIRSGDYWEKYRTLDPIGRKKLTLQRINLFLSK